MKNKTKSKDKDECKTEQEVSSYILIDDKHTEGYGDDLDLCSLLETACLEFVGGKAISKEHMLITLTDIYKKVSEEKQNENYYH